MNQKNRPKGEPENRSEDSDQYVPADDAVIGRAARWSAAIVVGIAVTAGIGLWLATRPEPTPPPREVEVRAPQRVEIEVDPPAATFTDITREAGIGFVHYNGARGEKLLPETMGGGCAFFDYDGDGDLDILFVNSTHWPHDPPPQGQRPTMALYANDGAGRFQDVTTAAGLDIAMYGMGVAVGDYDGDGDADLLLTAVGPNRLLRNDGGRFRDVTAEAGVGGADDAWSTSAGFFDYDGDGDLDLFVCNYVRWSRRIDLELDSRLVGIGRAYAPPMNFRGAQPYLYRNEGDGTFTDVSEAAGMHVTNDATGAPVGKALAVTFPDVDGDGRLDILVANDTVRNFYYHNRGDGSFEEMGQLMGLAYDNNGRSTGAMGIDAARHRNDADLGVFIGNFANEMTSAYVSQNSRSFFTDEAITEGIGAATRLALTFGLFLFDYDLDGRLDMLQANGHLEEEINQVQPSQHYKQSAQLFWNAGPRRRTTFIPVPAAGTGDLSKPMVGRGAAYADIDGDGDLDVLLTQVNGPPMLLRNDQRSGHHWLRCRLIGGGGNRDAIGTEVELVAGGTTQRRQVMPTRSYLSQVELPVTFGLGEQSEIESLRVTWPNGEVQRIDPPEVDRTIEVRQAPSEYRPLMNQAKALLENGENHQAIDLLEKALSRRPDSAPALRNLGRAYLAIGDADQALEALERAKRADPDSIAARYLTGLALARQGEHEQAIPYFEEAARLDPDTATIRFQLAGAYEHTGREEQALQQLGATVELDPAHSAAWFRLAMEARKGGDTEAYARRIREYERLKNLYGDRYESALAQEVCIHTKAEAGDIAIADAAPAQAIDVRFADATGRLAARTEDLAAGAIAALDMDERGRYTFFIAEPSGDLGLMRVSGEGRIERIGLDLKLPALGEVRQCLVGNYHDLPARAPGDGASSGNGAGPAIARLPDVLLVADGGLRLLRRTATESFEDATQQAGLAGVTARAARWVDYEHDGDLDLLTAAETGLELWRNNGNGTFTKATMDAGLPERLAAVGIATIDLELDNAIDLLAARGGAPTIVFHNRRTGRFERMTEPPGPWPAAHTVLANDLNNDGHADVALVGADEIVIRLGRIAGSQRIDLSGFEATAATLIDYDNDGWLDLCLAGRDCDDPRIGRLRMWRNGGAGPWAEVSEDLALGGIEPPIRGLLAVDFDNDRDTDLIATSDEDRLHFIENRGGHANGQLKLRLASLVGQRSPIDTHVEVRADDFWVVRAAQQPLPVEIGLGGRQRLDTVQTFWTNGVVHNELNIAAKPEPLDITIVRLVETGSCPFLYARSDDGFRFVTDMLGSGAIGLPLSRQAFAPVDPHETVIIGGPDTLSPRDGYYTVRITSELREATYLDHARLIAVDHPADVEIHSTDKLRPSYGEPSGLWALTDPIAPRRAVGDDGIDRTESVRAIDGVYAPPGPVLPPPLEGVCEPMALTLDFGSIDARKPLVLALSGWIRYGSASSNIALSQDASIPVIWPTLEAETADGRWVELDVEVGMPAGKDKTILVDLNGWLPEGVRRLRLTTTFELRWDRIALLERLPLPEDRVHEVRFTAADLAWHGFSDLRSRAPGHPSRPDPGRISETPPWPNALEGWCTRYGAVGELIDGADGKLAILNSGDGLTLRAPADGMPPLAEGLRRTFALRVTGWNKELNHNTADGDGIAPLPIDLDRYGAPDTSPDDDWHVRYNTRWVPGDRFRRIGLAGAARSE